LGGCITSAAGRGGDTECKTRRIRQPEAGSATFPRVRFRISDGSWSGIQDRACRRDVSSPYLGLATKRKGSGSGSGRPDIHTALEPIETARTRRPARKAGRGGLVEAQSARRTRTLGKAAGLPPSVEGTTDTTKATST